MLKGRWTARMLLTFAIACAIPAGTAEAAPDERAAAKAFADAARVYTKEVWDSVPSIKADLVARQADARRCDQLKLMPVAGGHRRLMRAIALSLGSRTAPVYAAMAAAHERFVASLDAVPTADPVLQSGRAAWRAELPAVKTLAVAPPDVCARLLEWQDGGYRGLPLPELAMSDLDTAMAASGAGNRKRRVAAQRLCELGQGPLRAARFTGVAADRGVAPIIGPVLDDWLDDFTDAILAT